MAAKFLAADFVMDAERAYVWHFVDALENRNDAAAISLLRSGHVTIRSLAKSYFGDAGEIDMVPLLFIAVRQVREKVVRELIRLGADIDGLHSKPAGDKGDMFSFSPAGEAFRFDNVDALALCHRLGANMSQVARYTWLGDFKLSAVYAAIWWMRVPCLEYLLDNVYVARPIQLTSPEKEKLGGIAARSGAKDIFKVLKTRGFNFKTLESLALSGGPRVFVADMMLAAAQQSGKEDLLRYGVRDLGMVSTAGRLGLSKAFRDGDRASGDLSKNIILEELPISPASLDKFECAACDYVGATRACTGCRTVRYCSQECSKAHWRTGGHKKICKDVQRQAAAIASGSSSSKIS